LKSTHAGVQTGCRSEHVGVTKNCGATEMAHRP